MSYANMTEVLQFFLQQNMKYFGFGCIFRCKRVHARSRPHLRYLFGSQDQEFGPHKIHASEIFARTALSFAFVNLKPVVPGRSNNAMVGAAAVTFLCESYLNCTSTRVAQRL